jgi:DNA-directed RNA polymerase subunit RPC12/RpoP|tara:strand:+ start:22 stop:171 length:150 start_codon:yes stop_codon:yes gene_type:complete
MLDDFYTCSECGEPVEIMCDGSWKCAFCGEDGDEPPEEYEEDYFYGEAL